MSKITKQISHILTPETEKLFFTGQILPPLLRGENVTIYWTPHGGMRTQMTFLIKNASSFGFSKLGKYQIFYLNPAEFAGESAEAYFLYMLYCTNLQNYKEDERKSAFFCLKEKITKITEEGFQLIFILGDIDQINLPIKFFDNLYSFWQINKRKIHFIFCLTKNSSNENLLTGYSQLAELMTQNKVYLGIFKEEDAIFTIKRLSKKYGFINKIKDHELITLAGGHPTLLRTCLRILNKSAVTNTSIKNIENQWEIRTILEDLWNSLLEEEKKSLSLIASGPNSQSFQISDYLLRMGIVNSHNGKYLIFSSLFNSFIKKQKIRKQTLGINKETGEILVDDFPTKEKITLKEYRLLSAFLENPNKVFSRDEIAEVLWVSEVDNKYSEWAIDQNISLLRKKLEKLGVSPSAVQTIKSRGYRWINL